MVYRSQPEIENVNLFEESKKPTLESERSNVVFKSQMSSHHSKPEQSKQSKCTFQSNKSQ